jgi:3-oxoacyl-[acyl-carrier protein] reductase
MHARNGSRLYAGRQTITLAGKVALVTGASRGLGRAIAVRPAGEGATAAVQYGTGASAAEETLGAITAAGGRAFPVQARVDDTGDTSGNDRWGVIPGE